MASKQELKKENEEAGRLVCDTLGWEYNPGYGLLSHVGDICEWYNARMSLKEKEMKAEIAKLKAENEKLKVSEEILGAYNKFINEGQGWEWFIYEISDEDKQMFLDAGLPDEDFD
tara:strand:- start:21 stop:365 length:345 start_codon:yes stop_codon:yes gene_type:complete